MTALFTTPDFWAGVLIGAVLSPLLLVAAATQRARIKGDR